ncbi:MAG: hypothetical protein MJZ19_11120 [Paludibacteraceae bacterium]|nr:hypothetical protein [Paludibacteraceae bacterium]
MGFLSDLKAKFNCSKVFDTIRKSEFVKNKPILNAVLNNPLVDDYFQRDLNSDTKADASFEKKCAVATAKVASQYLGFNKEKSKQAALAAADFVRDTRRVYQYEQKRISESEYNQHKEVSWWSRIKGVAKAAFNVAKDRVIDYVKEKGLSYLLKKAVKYIPNPVVQVATRVWDVIPTKVKEVVKEGAKKLAKKALESLPVVVSNVAECAKTVARTTVKVIEKGVEKAKSIGRELSKVAAPMVQAAKSVVKSVGEKIKNVGKKVLSFLGF